MDVTDDAIVVDVEDSGIHAAFAGVLKNFRIDFGMADLRSIALGFKLITYKKLITLYNSDPSQVELISNWVLECKFWTVLEALLDVKFNKDLTVSKTNDHNDTNICEYSSETVITDEVISSDTQLLQIFTSMKALSETFKLDFPAQSEDESETDFQTVKWLNTLNKLNNINRDPSLVKNLDIDAPLRTDFKIDVTDVSKDELFFKRAFKSLLSNEIEELKEISKLTNNWDFALLLTGLTDRIDPVIDLNDCSGNTVASGVKNKLLRKRTIYQLSKNEKISPYERACYGLLSSDLISCDKMIDTWEEKLYLYLDNYLNSKLESKMMTINNKLTNNILTSQDSSLITKLPAAPVMSNSIDDILNKLANDENDNIKNQSKHSIRVLIGSIISDNVKILMDNTIQSLDSLSLDANESNLESEISNESYLLRILTHLSIVLQLIYGEKLIKNDDYTKMLKCYIIRLMLYKSYELVPIYISFIPSNDDIIDIYSSILFQFEFSVNERVNQINNIRLFKLPLENILRNTIERAFNETIEYYPTNSEIQLIYDVDEIDNKLYSVIYWFIDAKMIVDALEAIVVLLRRFLLVGKIGSAIEFLESISLPQLINDYKFHASMYENMEESSEENHNLLSAEKLIELSQYHNLFSTFKLLIKYNTQSSGVEDSMELITSLDNLIKTWLFDLADGEGECNDDEIEVFRELRRIYIPNIFNQYFDLLLINYNLSKEKRFIRMARELVNVLADEEFKLYEIFDSTNELVPFLTKFADVSCDLYGEHEEGIYV